MLGNLMGNMEEKQNALKEKLSTIHIETSAADGKIKVLMTADKKLRNIQIDEQFRTHADPEELEDNLILALNDAIQQANLKEAAASQELLKEMMPPGFEDLFK